MDNQQSVPGEPLGRTPIEEAPKTTGSAGPTIGIAIIVALLIAGGFYFWMDAQKNPTMQMDPINDPQADSLSKTSESDSADSIEADLQATDLGDIDGEMNATESQI